MHKFSIFHAKYKESIHVWIHQIPKYNSVKKTCVCIMWLRHHGYIRARQTFSFHSDILELKPQVLSDLNLLIISLHVPARVSANFSFPWTMCHVPGKLTDTCCYSSMSMSSVPGFSRKKIIFIWDFHYPRVNWDQPWTSIFKPNIYL